MEHWQFEDV